MRIATIRSWCNSLGMASGLRRPILTIIHDWLPTFRAALRIQLGERSEALGRRPVLRQSWLRTTVGGLKRKHNSAERSDGERWPAQMAEPS